MKKAPLFFLIILSVILLTVVGFLGRKNIYATQETDYLKKPVLSAVFTGINDEIYPWDIFDSEKREAAAKEAEEIRQMEARMLEKQNALSEEEKAQKSLENGESQENRESQATEIIDVQPIPAEPDEEATAESEESKDESAGNDTASDNQYDEQGIPREDGYVPRYEPIGETSYDEYLSHISVDIYGDAGVNFAKNYEFKKVFMNYFDDALFIGDSRTVGLVKYTDISSHADALCETSLTIWKALKSDFNGKGTVESFLKKKDYKKIYIMVGVNELGTGTTEDFIEEYTYVVDRIHELEPEAIIFIQAIMNIDKEKSSSDKIFNNSNIMARNNAIATLADNETIFYIDENEAVCDEDGFLRDDLRGDHLHLLGSSNEIWKEFLLKHGVVK